jgi:hypothetical protein
VELKKSLFAGPRVSVRAPPKAPLPTIAHRPSTRPAPRQRAAEPPEPARRSPRWVVFVLVAAAGAVALAIARPWASGDATTPRDAGSAPPQAAKVQQPAQAPAGPRPELAPSSPATPPPAAASPVDAAVAAGPVDAGEPPPTASEFAAACRAKDQSVMRRFIAVAPPGQRRMLMMECKRAGVAAPPPRRDAGADECASDPMACQK